MFPDTSSRIISQKDPVYEYTDLYVRRCKAEGVLYTDPIGQPVFLY